MNSIVNPYERGVYIGLISFHFPMLCLLYLLWYRIFHSFIMIHAAHFCHRIYKYILIFLPSRNSICPYGYIFLLPSMRYSKILRMFLSLCSWVLMYSMGLCCRSMLTSLLNLLHSWRPHTGTSHHVCRMCRTYDWRVDLGPSSSAMAELSIAIINIGSIWVTAWSWVLEYECDWTELWNVA